MVTVQKSIDILLVEDNPNDVELILHVFGKYHLANRLHVLRDGAEAMEFLFHGADQGDKFPENPKVILLDLKLPRVEGLEVLWHLRADARTRTIPVVVVTSSREDRDLSECYRLGVNSYIVKPMDFDRFTEVIRLVGSYWTQLNEPPPLKT